MSSTFRSLRHPNYRNYFAGSAISSIGTWMMRIAQDWLVLQLTHDGTALGIATGLQFLPTLLLTPYAGLVVDRFSKRRVLESTQITMAVVSLVLGVLAITGAIALWLVYVIVVIFGIAAAFDGPARNSFVSEMVPPKDLPNAVGLNSASFNAAHFVGPALAGAIIGALGQGISATGVVMLINAGSYLAVLIQLHRMDVSRLQAPHRSPRRPGQLREGFRHLAAQPRLVAIIIIAAFTGAFGLNFEIMTALMATKEFGKGAGQFALVTSCLAIGSLLGSLLAARRSTIGARLVGTAALAFGCAELLWGAMPSYIAFVAVAPLVGLCSITVLNGANTAVQIAVDPSYRGRIMALYMTVTFGGTPIVAPIMGWIGQHVGARATIWTGGTLVIAGVVVAALYHQRTTDGPTAVTDPSALTRVHRALRSDPAWRSLPVPARFVRQDRDHDFE
ncbi:MFS transporter [Gordonia sp. DT30]|uniref:MFS transporter n=1 Tax=Gordonia sp. DT30 TaxID=3416546 RepID=UPI003CE886ED